MVKVSVRLRAISNQLQLILTVRRPVNADRQTDRQTNITDYNIILLMPCRCLYISEVLKLENEHLVFAVSTQIK